MGKNYYLGGSTKIGIYNKKENIIWRIYKVLHNDFVASHISFQTLKDYFEDYDYDDIVEIYKDVSINYQGRKVELFKKLRRFINSTLVKADIEKPINSKVKVTAKISAEESIKRELEELENKRKVKKEVAEIAKKEKKVKSQKDELKTFEMKRDLRRRINDLENRLVSDKKDESIENEIKILKSYLEKF
ncbi:hypothetical protein [Fusobacterium necrogenes]|uniref:hypothetical protein n=1 Tax=Fusobacterium necrogenes TaxID=858 RepID=UPI00255C71ED|nr:hypothetical protein [Fusobacterium necrogenes]